MNEERIHYHEITISEKTYPYYLVSCASFDLPDDDYSLEFEGEELIRLESARFKRWLNAIAKLNDEILHQWKKLDMVSCLIDKEVDSKKEFDSEKFKAFQQICKDFVCELQNQFDFQMNYNTVFRMIAEENSHLSRMANLESTVLRLEKKFEDLNSGIE